MRLVVGRILESKIIHIGKTFSILVFEPDLCNQGGLSIESGGFLSEEAYFQKFRNKIVVQLVISESKRLRKK